MKLAPIDCPKRPAPTRGCMCEGCAACLRRQRAERFARQTIAGLVLGLSLAWIVDRVVGGPGVLSIFGF